MIITRYGYLKKTLKFTTVTKVDIRGGRKNPVNVG